MFLERFRFGPVVIEVGEFYVVFGLETVRSGNPGPSCATPVAKVWTHHFAVTRTDSDETIGRRTLSTEDAKLTKTSTTLTKKH